MTEFFKVWPIFVAFAMAIMLLALMARWAYKRVHIRYTVAAGAMLWLVALSLISYGLIPIT